jgi:hypothetical protein
MISYFAKYLRAIFTILGAQRMPTLINFFSTSKAKAERRKAYDHPGLYELPPLSPS